LQRELHTLKGICATLGAETIEAALKAVEPLVGKREFAQIGTALVQVETDLQVLAGFLQQKIQAG
jgi:chemotaxis protein histidine kinase CheA